MIEVVVCCPVPALRAGLRALIEADPELEVTAALPALEDLPGWAPQAGLVVATPDALPPGWESGPVPDLALPDAALLLVGDEARWARALAGGELRAWGIVSPDAPAEALQAAVHALAEGLVAVSPAVLRQALERMPGQPGGDEQAPPGPVEPLTARETDVLRCLAQGLTNKQTALALQISEHTVKFHVSAIYAKLGVSNRTEASRKGARLGIVPL